MQVRWVLGSTGKLDRLGLSLLEVSRPLPPHVVSQQHIHPTWLLRAPEKTTIEAAQLS